MRRLAALVALALVLPLAACASPATAGVSPDLVRAGCPTDIRIQTDSLPRVEWAFLYGLLDAERFRVGDGEVSGDLLVDGTPTGATLTILTGDPTDGVSANQQLNDDPDLLLGAVDTDVAVIDAKRYPTVGVFAPLARDPRLLFWDAENYPALRNIERIAGTTSADGTALPVASVPGDPFIQYAVGSGWITPEQIVAGTDVDVELTVPAFVEGGGVRAQAGDDLVDPYLLSQDDVGRVTRWQVIDDIGYTRDAGVLSAEPQTLVRYADCFQVLVPVLQQALVDYAGDPEPANELVVELAAQLGDTAYGPELAAAATAELLDARYLGNGRDDTIGDLDLGRVRGLLENAVPRWRDAEVPLPSGVTADTIVTNRFIDRSIGL